MDIFGPITWFDIIYAAIAAAGVTYLLTRVQKKPQNSTQKPPLFGETPKEGQVSPAQRNMPQSLRGLEGEDFISQCKLLFPEETFDFCGLTFHRGEQVHIVTVGQRIIQGELIGQNDQKVICIRTERNVIAQKASKILEMRPINKA